MLVGNQGDSETLVRRTYLVERGSQQNGRRRLIRTTGYHDHIDVHHLIIRALGKAEVVESLGRGHGVDNLADPAGDVVADEAHAVDFLTAAFGGFVGVPDLDRGAVDGLHLGRRGPSTMIRSTEAMRSSELFRGLVGDVDTDLKECLCG